MSRIRRSGNETGNGDGISPDPEGPAMIILKECLPYAEKYLGAIGCGPGPVYRVSEILDRNGNVRDMKIEDGGWIKTVTNYIVTPESRFEPEITAAREGMKLFEKNAESYLSGDPDGLRGFVSIVVVIDPPGELRGEIAHYHVMSRRRGAGIGGEDSLLDIMIIGLGECRSPEFGKQLDFLNLVFDKEKGGLGTAMDLLGKFRYSSDLKTVLSVESMHGYLRGYLEGRRGIRPTFDFNETVEEVRRGEMISYAEAVLKIRDEKGISAEEPLDALGLTDYERRLVREEMENLLRKRRIREEMISGKTPVERENP